ncbi:phage transcriptional regulator, ArpU family [Clostridium sporogenes]|nr:phage transcriptional regulator, ArpU family [Clostridium sporogenes]
MLEVLSEDERTVINLLYFSESKISTTSACMKVGMSQATFYRVKGKALKKLDRLLN